MKTIYSLVFLLLWTLGAWSQYADESPDRNKVNWRDRIDISGNVQLSFGSVTVIGLNPKIGYKVTETTVLGIGGDYVYYRSTNPVLGSFESSIYGYNVFARQDVVENIFLMAEYGRLNWEPAFESESIWVDMLYLGGGYRQYITNNFSLGVTILWDVIDDPNSPYQNPIFRGGGFLSL